MSKGLKGKFKVVLNNDGTTNASKSHWTLFSNDSPMYSITVEEICRTDISASYSTIATREYGYHLLKWWRDRAQNLTAFW